MTTRVLPPPTDLDLAVIRARVEGRDLLGRPGAVRWGPLAAVVSVLAVAMLVDLGLVVFSDDSRSPAPGVLGATLVAVVTACIGHLALRRTRLLDGAVRSRLGAVTVVDAERRRPGATEWVVVALPLAATGVSAAAAVDLLRRSPGWAVATGLLVPLLLGGLVTRAVRDVLLLPVLGHGEVQRAVDTAIARQDLANPLLTLLTIFTARALVMALRRTGMPFWGWVDLALSALFVVALAVNAWVRSSTRPLLEDWRLHFATPPKAWLAGAPPSPEVLRESAL